MADLADVAIDAILADFPDHRSGTRPIHAPGTSATGWFQPSPVAACYSSADHFTGDRVRVTVRFSNGTGVASEPDFTKTVRGMAVKFHLGEVHVDEYGVIRSSVEADLVSMTLPVFFSDTLDDFLRFAKAAIPRPEPPPTLCSRVVGCVDRVKGVLRLLPVDPGLSPSGRAVVDFADEYPPARLCVAATTLLDVPESYATCCYHAVHAFRLTAGAATTSVRFHWEPVAGVRPAPKGVGATFLRDELAQRLLRGPAEFVLRAQVAEAGDDTSDPTTPWPQARRRVIMGQLSLDAMPSDQDRAAERVSFNPTRLVAGIDLSDDPVLLARREVYERSAVRRLAARNESGG